MTFRERPSLWLSYAALCAVCAPLAAAQDTAFYYGPDVPHELLTVYEQVVVEPSHVSDLAALSASGRAALVAYLSIGEVAESDARPIDPAWVLGRNGAWASRVMDVTHAGYRRFVLERFEALWRAGYRRFFLDTLDSYALAVADPQLRAAQIEAHGQLIRAFSSLHPEARFLLNRGFELLPDIASLVHGVVAESLFDGWDAAHSSYVRVSDADRSWLYQRLREARDRYRLPVIVIDYRPAHERDEARQTAQRIADLGFTPWVCGSSVSDVGVGALEVLPRRVLIVNEAGADAQPGPARWLAPVLEYLGYVAEYRTPATLPVAALRGRYAGIITALESSDAGASYERWLRAQLAAGLRVAIFGELGFAPESETARALGIRAAPEPLPGDIAPRATEVSARDSLIGFEAEPALHAVEGVPLQLEAAAARHLELRLANGEVATAVATTTWGGLARSHVFAPRGLHGQRAWVLDPFAFVSRALALPLIPVPDLTTESGGRVALFAIDMEGAGQYARLRGRPLVSQVLAELLAEQPWPHALGMAGSQKHAADAAALQTLLSAPRAYAGSIPAGKTSAHGSFASLTEVAPLFAGEHAELAAPIASEASYLDGSSESYAFERVLQTFAFTDAPRRLSPLALNYHAYVASSLGGVTALREIYAALAHTPLFAITLSEYRDRVRAFQQQVLARDVHGRFHVFGGQALRTVRVPPELGPIDVADSRAVVTESLLPQGHYVTFSADGARSLSFRAVQREPLQPCLSQTNGRVEYYRITGDGASRGGLQIAFAASALQPLVLRFAGLPPQAACVLALANTSSKQTLRVTSDPSGRAELVLAAATTGASTLTCPAP